MRKLFSFIVTSLDGYYEGPNREFDWPIVDAEFERFSVEQLDEVDTLVFGRVTYEGMAAYWPTPEAHGAEPVIAARMNDLSKIVVSRTLREPGWSNTRVAPALADIAKLKEQPGTDIATLGSSALTASLLAHGLLDELRIMVHPVLLGAGRSLLSTADTRARLTLVESRLFSSGSVLLRYQPRT